MNERDPDLLAFVLFTISVLQCPNMLFMKTYKQKKQKQTTTQGPLYNTTQFSTVSDITQFKHGPQKIYTQTNMYRLYRKMTIYGHFSI